MTFFYFTNKQRLTAKIAKEEAQSSQRRTFFTLRPLRILSALCGSSIFLLIPVLLLFFSSLQAQDCSFTLSKAQKNFEAGVIEQIPQSLQPCIENGFTKEEKLQAYKLIIQCYLFDNNTAEAEKAMLNFLKKNPEYEVMPTDQAEFTHLFETYRSVPIASIGILGFTNFSSPQQLLVLDPSQTNGSYKNTGFGVQVGLSYRQFISKLFDVNLECFYVTSSYQYAMNSTTMENSSSQFTDNFGMIAVPLTGIYKPITWWKFEPYVRAGLSFGYILSSSVTGDTKTNSVTDNKITSLNNIDNRNLTQFSGVLGAGIGFNLKKSSLVFDLRYNQAFTGFVKVNAVNDASKQLKNDILITENDLLLNNFWISVGYFYKFYKPEKRKTK